LFSQDGAIKKSHGNSKMTTKQFANFAALHAKYA